MSPRALANQAREVQTQRLSKLAKSLLLLSATVMSFSAFMLLMADQLYRPESFVIDQLKIQGKFRYLDPVEVEEVIDSDSLGNFFSIDLLKIKQQVEAIAWVQSADVRREWPNTLLIDINEHRPVMSWTPLNQNESRETDYWLTSLGDVVALSGEIGIADPIELSANKRDSKLLLSKTYQWKQRVEHHQLELVGVNLSESHAWQLRLKYLDKEFDVLLGRVEVAQRLSRFLHLFDNQFRHSNQLLTRVDARYPNGLAIQSETVELEDQDNDQLASVELNDELLLNDKSNR